MFVSNWRCLKDNLSIYITSSPALSRVRSLHICYTLILDLKILTQTSFCFWLFQIHYVYFTTFTVPQTHILLLLSPIFLHLKAIQSVFLHYKPFEKVSKTIACFPAFYSNFCIKSYKRVFWSFPTKEPIFVPTILSLSLFNLSAWIISRILYKNHLSLHLSQSEPVWVVLVPRGILVFSHQINFGQRGILKYLIFGNLFILVRCAIFNCFTLRCFQVYIFTNFILTFCSLVQIRVLIAV